MIGLRWANNPTFRRLRILAHGGFCVATALVPVIAFVSLLDPNGPLRGTRSPDPLPMPDAYEGGLHADMPSVGVPDQIDFCRLQFRVPEEDRTAEGGVDFLAHTPADIRALDGRTVQITGFMIPVETAGANVRRCVIVPSQANCCYGQAPRFCEFIVATMTGPAVRFAPDVPLAFTGTLRVGDTREHGVWSAFYTLECTGVVR